MTTRLSRPASQARAALTAHRILHAVSFYLLAALALAVVGYTAACGLGFAPWLEASVNFGGTLYLGAGPIIQIAVTMLIALLSFFMPSANRIMQLERAHRDFRITMEDVTRAYYAAHTADRAGVFTLSSEFDAVRQRLAFLRDHPDLAALEPDALELAAQMSEKSRELADVYSDEKVARAKAFLTQRQQEAEHLQDQVTRALHDLSELRIWAEQVDVEESIAASQLNQLQERLDAVLPPLGPRVVSQGTPSAPRNVAPTRDAAE